MQMNLPYLPIFPGKIVRESSSAAGFPAWFSIQHLRPAGVDNWFRWASIVKW
jgi:hypothetical protein